MSRERRILIVDDMETWREQITSTLRRVGYQVDAASTLVEALERLNNYIYHLIILDLRIDETDIDNLDGFNILAKLRQQKLTNDIKVIMLTGYGTVEQMRQAFRDYHVVNFLSKSQYNKQIIREAVQRAFTE